MGAGGTGHSSSVLSYTVLYRVEALYCHGHRRIKEQIDAATGLRFSSLALTEAEEPQLRARRSGTLVTTVQFSLYASPCTILYDAGAAMTNVFWLARGATVLEMYPAWPNEPLQEGTDVNPGSNYGRFAALSGARHVVWVQKSLPKEASNVPFRKVDVTMDLVHFRLVAENAYKAWQASNCS